jgi:hypothetical protein
VNSTLPHDLDYLRNRVRLYVQVILTIDLLAYGSDVIGPILLGDYGARVPPVRWFVTSVLLGSWAFTRFGRPSRFVVMGLEGAVTIVLSFAYVKAGDDYLTGALDRAAGGLVVALGIVLLLVVRSALVPSSVPRTAAIGVGAFAVLIGTSFDDFQHTETIVAEGLVFMAFAFVIATSVTSRVIYGLRAQVRRALRLGQYELGQKLGAGGMGTVYRASHAMLRRDAAIKLIQPELIGGDSARRSETFQRFEREAQVTARLESPHTVQLYDFGVSPDGAFYYVMELLDGIDLHRYVDRFGPMEPARAVHVLRQVCESLEEAHRAGLVHRDIKPANILLCRYGLHHDFAKVLDFGLVTEDTRSTPSDDKLTADGAVAGTPAFIAPELASGDAAVDGRADLYALGCVAYWLLTGRVVFEKPTPMATVIAHVTEVPTPPSLRTELAVPAGLEAAVLRCLAKDPAARPASALELAAELGAVAIEPPWTGDDAARWWEGHVPRASRDLPRDDGEPAFITTAYG